MKQRIWVLDPNTNVYAFCNFVRKFYDKDGIPSQTNLCKICQSTFWGLLFLLISIPSIIVGWIGAKLGRVILSRDNRFSIFLCEKVKLGDIYRDAPSCFSDSPIMAGWLFTAVSLVIVALPIAVLSAVGAISFNFLSILSGLWSVCISLGWACFLLMAAIGGLEVFLSYGGVCLWETS